MARDGAAENDPKRHFAADPPHRSFHRLRVRREVADVAHRPQLSPVLFRFSLHRWRLRVLDLEPMLSTAGTVSGAEPL
jgi:hypothetical protein